MPPTPERPLDSRVVYDALHGRPSALRRFCAHYQPLVLRIVRHVAARRCSPDDTREIAQEVWCRLLEDGCRRLRPFDPARGSFDTFLRLVTWQQAARVVRVWAGHRRRHQRFERIRAYPQPTPLPSPAALEARQLLVRIVQRARPALDRVDQQLLCDLAIDEVPVCTLAPQLGRSPASLYKRKQRLFERLAKVARGIGREGTRRQAHAAWS